MFSTSAGQILNKLRSTGLASNTYVVFASDNGAWLNPNNGLGQGVRVDVCTVRITHAGSDACSCKRHRATRWTVDPTHLSTMERDLPGRVACEARGYSGRLATSRLAVP